MKKNKLFLLPFVACALLWSACSNELEVSDNPNRAGAGEAILSVSLQFPQADKPVGYAPGDLNEDVLPGVALDEEKEIRSIAFFAFTSGNTGIYLSTNPALSENGFTDPLKPTDDGKKGSYTASFKITSGDFSGTTTLVAIANFEEHGLTFDPKNLTVASLKSMLTKALEKDNSIEYPLLMTVAKEMEIVDGSTSQVDFVMERIMARVDVVNNAYDKTTTDNGFVLTSARLLSASAQGTMIGGQTIANPTYVDMKAQTTVAEIDPGNSKPFIQQLSPMYAYENSNTKADDNTTMSENATSVEVKGTYKGKAYTKVIPFKTMEKVVGGQIEGGEIVPIARNFRYVVEITSGKEEELTFDLKVTDWTEGKELEVEIEFAEPKLEGLDNIAPNNGATWDADTKTLNITAATGATDIEFAVNGFQDTDFMFAAEYDANATPLSKTIKVERGVLSGYADAATEEKDPLSRTYKVTIPAYTGECPSLTKLIVYNAAYADAQTEIFTVKYSPVFVTDLKATQSGTVIDQGRRLISLNGASNTASTFTFFASCNVDVATPTVDPKNTTTGFYTFSKSEPETDSELIGKYGPGKRITMAYKALNDTPRLGEISVYEKGADPSTAKKLFVKCFRKPYFDSYKFAPNADNALADGNQLYLAVNNGDHGTIDYTVYDDVNNTITLAPTASNAGSVTPTWIKNITKSSDEIVETYSDFQIVKRTVKVALPDVIKAPAQATNFKVGVNTSTAATLTLTPVYLSGETIAERDKAFRPVLVKTIWWSPINIGQTKISELNDSSEDGGNLFQWGRKTPLTWDSTQQAGPVESAEAAGTNFITNSGSTRNWLKTQNNQLWNRGTEASPQKTDNDPCPVGWRVPTLAECNNSIKGSDGHTFANANSSSALQNCLLTVPGNSGNDLYFPAVGSLENTGYPSYRQGAYGYYWTSTVSATNIQYLLFDSPAVNVFLAYPAYGMPVRCVQE